ncbi:hypothetical protein QTN25_008415 [Entamoeba marina]
MGNTSTSSANCRLRNGSLGYINSPHLTTFMTDSDSELDPRIIENDFTQTQRPSSTSFQFHHLTPTYSSSPTKRRSLYNYNSLTPNHNTKEELNQTTEQLNIIQNFLKFELNLTHYEIIYNSKYNGLTARDFNSCVSCKSNILILVNIKNNITIGCFQHGVIPIQPKFQCKETQTNHLYLYGLERQLIYIHPKCSQTYSLSNKWLNPFGYLDTNYGVLESLVVLNWT